MKKILLLFVCLLTVGWGSLYAQTTQVSGVVTETGGEPLAGVSVVIKGTTRGTNTDVNGRYVISVPQDASLVFSFQGKKTQETAVNSRSIIDVAMTDDATVLQDIVITGYAERDKNKITASVGTVKAEQLENVPSASFQQMLQGTTPGVQVIATTGRPSAGATVRVRGVGSISAGTNPLYVMDGVPVSSTDFASMNSNDIETVTILKDAVATSIYGSRGANGVIVITTKRGKGDEPRIEARAQVGWLVRTQDKFDMMNSPEKLTYEKALGIGKGSRLSEAEIATYPVNINWLNEIMRTGLYQNYELTVSGSTPKTSYYLSGQYYNVTGIVPGSDMVRYAGRANVEYKAKNWLTIANKLSIGTYKEDVVRSDRNVLNPFNYAYTAEPYFAPYKADGTYNFVDAPNPGFNIFEQLETNVDKRYNLRLINSASAEIAFMKDLKFKTILGTDYAQTRRYYFIWPQATLSTLNGYEGVRTDGYADAFNLTSTNTLTYNFTIADKNSFNLMAAFETLYSEGIDFTLTKMGFPNERVDAMNSGARIDSGTGNNVGYTTLSYFLTASYSYDSKYVVEGLIRRDASSRFGPNNRWGTFWAIGGAWNAHNEEFIKSLNIISNLKLSANYGTQGNAAIPNYEWRGTYSYGKYNGETTAYPSRIPNENLTWEKSNQFSAGLAIGLWDSRLNFDIQYYNRKTTDMLSAAQVSRTTGFTSRTENVGEMTNKGIEIGIDGEIYKDEDWTIGAKASITTLKNEVTKLYNGDDIRAGIGSCLVLSEGYPIYNYMMVRYAGVNPTNGDALYYDKDGKITNVWDANNAVKLDGKAPLPKYYGNFDLNVAWRGVELSANFYYSVGNYVYNHVSYFTLADGAGAAGSNMDRRLLTESWKQPGDIVSIPRQSADNVSHVSDRYLEDASYFRLRNLTIAYVFPKSVTSKMKLEKLRIYAQGQNLWTLTAFTGFDPEVGQAPSGGFVGYANDYNYPAARTFTVGIDIGF